MWQKMKRINAAFLAGIMIVAIGCSLEEIGLRTREDEIDINCVKMDSSIYDYVIPGRDNTWSVLNKKM